MSTLDEVREEIQAYEAASPRAQQVSTGASQLYGCRAESMLRHLGVTETDPRASHQAWVGKWIHVGLEKSAGEGVITEQRGFYKGIPVTVDRLDQRQKKLTDYKTKDGAAEIREIKRTGPSKENRAQIHVGAAAMIYAGYEVDTVELLYLPRAGKIEDGWLFAEPFDRSIAEEAVEWAYVEQQRAFELEDFDESDVDPLDGLRDEPASFCRSYCPFVTACRGPEVLPMVDERTADIMRRYHQAKTRRDEAEADMKMLRPDLEGISGQTDDGYKARWQGGNVKESNDYDYEQILADYRSIIGEPPTKHVTKVTALSLRVEKVAS